MVDLDLQVVHLLQVVVEVPALSVQMECLELLEELEELVQT
tara:strand:+ start:507 stop:629 length:123 start_codon:yes stop_codon:yes gene_type:complete